MMYVLVPTEKIRALEYVFPHHLKNLQNMILKDGVIKYPLIVEKKYKIVLDGSHRHVFLAMKGFRYCPVLYVDYNDPHIRVGTHRLHRLIIDGPVNISKEEVIRRGKTGDLFPPRTTRHFFPFLRPQIDVPLKQLKKRKPIDMSKNISKVDISEEIEHNQKYIKEIEEETEELIRYLEEGIRTKRYLTKQIEEMRDENTKRY